MNNSSKGFCVWLSGLSGAGKSTLAELLAEDLKKNGRLVEILDGDIIRTNLSQGLGFSREDRESNLKRIAFVADLLSRNGVAVIVAAISPYQNIRDIVRERVTNYIGVYVNCPLDRVIERDPKGLYKKALAGEIEHFTGISDPYEPPQRQDVDVRTDLQTPEESLTVLKNHLKTAGFIEEAD